MLHCLPRLRLAVEGFDQGTQRCHGSDWEAKHRDCRQGQRATVAVGAAAAAAGAAFVVAAAAVGKAAAAAAVEKAVVADKTAVVAAEGHADNRLGHPHSLLQATDAINGVGQQQSQA